MNYIKRFRVTAGKWDPAPASGWQEYLLWSQGECSVVLGDIQRVKVRDKVMSYINLFHSGRGYYHGNIRISWKYPRSVDIIRILSIYLYSVDIIRILWIYLRSVDIIHISKIYPNLVDIIGIGQITNYLACNVFHDLHSFVLVVDITFGHITSYLACNVRPISHILLI